MAPTSSTAPLNITLREAEPGDAEALGQIVFDAFGAIQPALTGIAGTNNQATITLRGVSRQIDVVAADSLPADPSGSNTVTVLPSSAP